MPSKLELTAAIVVGDSRSGAQASLDSLNAQTAREAMEIVVIDLNTTKAPPLRTSAVVPTRYVTSGPDVTWGRARAHAVELASAPVVAFIEDHCSADASWAEALIRAHRQPWAAVGYAFTNPPPDTYMTRAILFAEYGPWLHPTRSRQARVLPCGNVAYKRDLLVGFGEELESLLTPDFVVHERLMALGHPLYIAGDAVVAHHSLTTIGSLVIASFLFCRILAARRARAHGWGTTKRVAYGLATPFMSPPIALVRLARRSADASFGRTRVLRYLPTIAIKSISSALGESAGYLIGQGEAERKFGKWELHVNRIAS